MNEFNFIEMQFSTGEPTGNQQPIVARSFQDAVATMLLALKLKKFRRACVGPTGRVLYPEGAEGDRCWVLPQDRVRIATGRR